MKKGWIICGCVFAALLIVLAVAFRLTGKENSSTTSPSTSGATSSPSTELPPLWFN